VPCPGLRESFEVAGYSAVTKSESHLSEIFALREVPEMVLIDNRHIHLDQL